MTKKHFIMLADTIKEMQKSAEMKLNERQIQELAYFCKQMNPNFNYERFTNYIAGTCGPHGGKVKGDK